MVEEVGGWEDEFLSPSQVVVAGFVFVLALVCWTIWVVEFKGLFVFWILRFRVSLSIESGKLDRQSVKKYTYFWSFLIVGPIPLKKKMGPLNQ